MRSGKIEVLVVDDSAVVRQAVTAVLSRDSAIRVIAAVADPIFAMQRMKMHWPQVIVLDIEMPRMDGLTFLRKIMAEHPTPVVVCSTLTGRGTQASMQALAAGAFAVLQKPRFGAFDFMQDISANLVHAVKAAAFANLRNLQPAPPLSMTSPLMRVPAAMPGPPAVEAVVAIGASTGGTLVLESVLSLLPATAPGIVVVQHMPEKFTAAFAERLDGVCQVTVREARNGDLLTPGVVLIAPGGRQMALQRSGGAFCVEVKTAPPVNRHCPSVDVLFRSVARVAGRNALGIIMTGMGADGALGLRQMREAGARTLAQSEATCVVFGMPQEAIKIDAVDRVLAPASMPREIVEYAFRAGHGVTPPVP